MLILLLIISISPYQDAERNGIDGRWARHPLIPYLDTATKLFTQESIINVRMQRLAYSVGHSVCRGVCFMMTPRQFENRDNDDGYYMGYVDDNNDAAYTQMLEATRQCMLEILQKHNPKPGENTV